MQKGHLPPLHRSSKLLSITLEKFNSIIIYSISQNFTSRFTFFKVLFICSFFVITSSERALLLNSFRSSSESSFHIPDKKTFLSAKVICFVPSVRQ